jgi:hypothetical protein
MAAETAPQRSETQRRTGLRTFWRMGAWGGGAVLALAAVALAGQTESGSKRLALALSPMEKPAHAVATIKFQRPDPETVRLSAQVRELTEDRDRLNARLASIEQQIDDVTGSVKRLADAPKPPPVVEKTEAAPPPAIAPLATTAALPAPKPAAPTEAESTEKTAMAPEAPSPPVMANVPLPPTRLAAIEPVMPQFAVALAASSSVALIHMQWAAVKANFGANLHGLSPRVLSEHHGSAMHYQLLAGPLPSYTDAAKLCARINAAHGSCHPVKYGGDAL